jgi:hypothetical protein
MIAEPVAARKEPRMKRPTAAPKFPRVAGQTLPTIMASPVSSVLVPKLKKALL